jgi:hypothetical protein
MNPVTRSLLPICAATTVLIAICPAPAEAHLNATGMGPVYDGMAHFLMSPEDVVPVLALALLVGMRGASYGRRALFVLPAAWLLGGFVGLPESATNGSAVLSAIWFLLLGGLLAADVRVSSVITTLHSWLRCGRNGRESPYESLGAG